LGEPLQLLACPNCRAALRTEDLDLERGLSRCGYCRAVAVLPKLPGASAAAAILPRADVALPPGLQVEDQRRGLRITRRWFSAIVFFLIPLCVAWNAFLVFLYGGVLATGGQWFFALIPVAHVVVGIGLSYSVLALLVNRTIVTVDGGKLSIAHGPLPWKGNAVLDARDVDQLYCKLRLQHGKDSTSESFELWALLRDRTRRKLVATAFTEEQVLFVEQRVERALKIQDRAIAGELGR
jgi:hypothetical protein